MNEFEFNFDVDNDDENFEFPKGYLWSNQDATIFLIDAAPEMFQIANENNVVPFMSALKCVHSVVSRKIIDNSQDTYAVILFNTTSTRNDLEFPHVYVLQDIDKPGAERILELENLLSDCTGKATKQSFGSVADANIHEAFWVCRNIFIKSKKNLSSKSLFLFTLEDDPHAGDDHKCKQAIKGANDLKEIGVELEILPLGNIFDFHKFYKLLVLQDGDDDEENVSLINHPLERIDDLLERVCRVEHKKRSLGSLTLKISSEVEMGIKIFSSFRKIYKSNTKLYKLTNEEIISQRKEYLEETGGLLMPSDLLKYQQFGGKKLKFSMDEVKFLSNLYDSCIELLGFKPMSYFKPYFYVKPANFIYPDEMFIKGSIDLFLCLLERCIVNDVCPVVRVTTGRQGASVNWAFLLPQKEVYEGESQVSPSGFYICYLPFADDFRAFELQNRIRASSSQVDAAKVFLKKLNFKYHPESFENPEIQVHWRNLEALALNRHQLEDVIDYTVPDYKGIEKKSGQLIEHFKSLVLSPSYDPQQMSKKRVAAPKDNGAKRMKVDNNSAISVEELARGKKVNNLKVEELKEWLVNHGVKVTGKKKGQLVQDVYDQLQIEI